MKAFFLLFLAVLFSWTEGIPVPTPPPAGPRVVSNWQKPLIPLSPGAQLQPLCDPNLGVSCLEQWTHQAQPFALGSPGTPSPVMQYYLPALIGGTYLNADAMQEDKDWEVYDLAFPTSRRRTRRTRRYYASKTHPGRVRRVDIDEKGEVTAVLEAEMGFVPADAIKVTETGGAAAETEPEADQPDLEEGRETQPALPRPAEQVPATREREDIHPAREASAGSGGAAEGSAAASSGQTSETDEAVIAERRRIFNQMTSALAKALKGEDPVKKKPLPRSSQPGDSGPAAAGGASERREQRPAPPLTDSASKPAGSVAEGAEQRQTEGSLSGSERGSDPAVDSPGEGRSPLPESTSSAQTGLRVTVAKATLAIPAKPAFKEAQDEAEKDLLECATTAHLPDSQVCTSCENFVSGRGNSATDDAQFITDWIESIGSKTKTKLGAQLANSDKVICSPQASHVKGIIYNFNCHCNANRPAKKPCKNTDYKCDSHMPFDEFFPVALCENCASGVPLEVMLSIIHIESSGRCNVVNRDGEVSAGLCQINADFHSCKGNKPGTPKNEKCFLELSPPRILQECLKILKEKYGRTNPKNVEEKTCPKGVKWAELGPEEKDAWRRAVSAYNGGEKRVKASLKLLKEAREKPKDSSVSFEDLRRFYLVRELKEISEAKRLLEEGGGRLSGTEKKNCKEGCREECKKLSGEEKKNCNKECKEKYKKLSRAEKRRCRLEKIAVGKGVRSTLNNLAHTEALLGRNVKGAPPGIVAAWSKYVESQAPRKCPADPPPSPCRYFK